MPIKAANTSIMGKCSSTALGLYKMQHTNSLTLCWRSFSDWGYDHVAISVTHNGCQYVDSVYMPYQNPGIIEDATPKIIDTLLTLYWRWVDALLTLCWRSVDALLTLYWRSVWGVAESIHTILPIKTANTSIMGKCCSTALGSSKMQHTNSLTLWWRSLSGCGCDHVATCFVHNGSQYVDSGYIL